MSSEYLWQSAHRALDFCLKTLNSDGRADAAKLTQLLGDDLHVERMEERPTVIRLVNSLFFSEKHALYCRYCRDPEWWSGDSYQSALRFLNNNETGLSESLMLKYFGALRRSLTEIGAEYGIDRRRASEQYDKTKGRLSPIEERAMFMIEQRLIDSKLIPED